MRRLVGQVFTESGPQHAEHCDTKTDNERYEG